MLPTPDLPNAFGPALRYLRKRALLTQEELGRAVGYSREQIARLENGSRLPDLAVVAALFVPALRLERERALVERFLALAGETRRELQVTVTHQLETSIQVVKETVTFPDRPRYIPPAPLLPLLGRESELNDLLARLETARLVTIVGAPGIGKTRFALEVAGFSLDRFADGAAFVPLAEAGTAADIPYAVLRHLSLTPSPQQSPDEAIVAALAPRSLLLVLDNCEHVLDGVEAFAGWLARAPGLKILCTSRVPLDLYGEYEWPLAPLQVPVLAEPPDVERWGALPSLQLLLARAQAGDPTFRLTDDNILPLATLCVALDGLPLALELAAVRLREMPPHGLVQELLALRGRAQLSSTWLGQTRRNIAERHRTLQAAIDWSVHRLPLEDQNAFARLGVFTGGCTADAALSVSGADEAVLARLIRASLTQISDGRVSLLETLRAFAREALAATDDLEACQQAHARYYAGFAQQVFAGLRGDDQASWMARALADHDNCLAALRWALAEEDGDTAVAIAGGLWWFWYRRGLFALGRGLVTAALELPSSDLAIRAAAFNGAAALCMAVEDYEANFAYHEQGLALRRQLNDAEGVATVLHNMGLTAFTLGNFDQAAVWLRESIDAWPDGDQTSAWAHLGLLAQETQDLPEAQRWLELAYSGAEAAADGWTRAFVMNYLADVLRELGEYDEAAQLAGDSLRLFTEMNDAYYLPDAQITLAQIAMDRGDYATSGSLVAAAAAQYEAREDALMIASALLVQADLEMRQGRRDEAATLLRRSRALRQSVTRAVSPREEAGYQALERALTD